MWILKWTGLCYQVRNNMWVCVMARSAAAIKRQEEVKFFAEPEVDKYNTHLRISQLSTTLSIDLDTFVEMYFSLLQVHLSGNAVGHLQTTNKKHKRGDILSSVISASVLEFLSFFWPQSSSHHRIKAMRSLSAHLPVKASKEIGNRVMADFWERRRYND